MPDTKVFPTELTAETLDRKLEHYEVRAQIGHGSMGIVYEAIQVGVGRQVAIKVLPPSMTLRERTVKRFLREAEAMGRLSHSNIVDIYEVGSVGSLHFFAMRHVEGPALDRVLTAGPMAVSDVLQIGIDVAGALAHAHSRGVLHRDVKPSNLLRDGERVVLTDFGLARPIDAREAGSMTESGDLVGTPLYMSPEQIQGEAAGIDGRSDIWGLGATLYELLTQRPPFTGPSAQAILNAILHKQPALLRKQRDDVPRDLEAVLLKCLAKDTDRRYATAAALVADLEAVRLGQAVSASRPRFYDPALRWTRRHPIQSGVAGVLLVVIAALWVAFSGSSQQLRETQDDLGKAERLQREAELLYEKAEATREEAEARLRVVNALQDLLEANEQWAWALRQERRLLQEYLDGLSAIQKRIHQGRIDSMATHAEKMRYLLGPLRRLTPEKDAELRRLEAQKALAEDRVDNLSQAFPITEYPELGQDVIRVYAQRLSEEGREAILENFLVVILGGMFAKDPETQLAVQAVTARGVGDPEKALALYRQRLEEYPPTAEALHDAGKVCRELGELDLLTNADRFCLDEALRYQRRAFVMALAAGTKNFLAARALTEQARCHLALKDYGKALLCLDDALGLYPALTPAEALRQLVLRRAAREEGGPAPEAAGLGVLPSIRTEEDLISLAQQAEDLRDQLAADAFQTVVGGLRSLVGGGEADQDEPPPAPEEPEEAGGGDSTP